MTIAVKRALSLLELFTETLPEIGLSDAARLSGHDKATVHRLLNTLREADLVEQDPHTKLYRIGPAVLRLARVREKSTPLLSIVQPLLGTVTLETGETAHFSLYKGESLRVVANCTSSRPNHVAINKMETLPLHATASGLACLAFSGPEVLERLLTTDLKAYTNWTITDPATLRQAVEGVRKAGLAIVDRSYDEDVLGIAVPVLGASKGVVIGYLAVAAPRHRMNETAKAKVAALLREAAGEVARRMGVPRSAALI